MILRAASARGRSHRFMAKVRQDAYAFQCDGRYVVAAVADGVSSGSLSHVAADVVSRHGCHMIARQLETTRPEHLDWGWLLETLKTKVINEGRRRLEGSHKLDDRAVGRQLATTALFAVVEMWAVEGAHRAHILALGDSSAWVLRSGTRWEPQFPVKNDGAELASSTTSALPFLPKRLPSPVETMVGADDALLLISDGIGDPLRYGDGSVGAFLAEQWRRPPEPLAFAAHVDFARRSHDDDRTALGIWPGS